MADKTFSLYESEKKWKSSRKPEEKWGTFCRHVKVMKENFFFITFLIKKKKCFSHECKKLIKIKNFEKD